MRALLKSLVMSSSLGLPAAQLTFTKEFKSSNLSRWERLLREDREGEPPGEPYV